MSAALGPICVMGAGSIGCFVGGRLAAAGHEVHFIGRARIGQAARTQGLRLTDFEAPAQQLSASQVHWHESLNSLKSKAGLVLLCVKSGATASACAELAMHLAPGTPVLSLQNGVDNLTAGLKAAPGLKLLPGMVPFNVAELAPGHFHRGSSGQLAAQDDPQLRPYAPRFAAAGLPLTLHADLAPVQWGKLLLNLNNPVNALSGLPLRAQLMDRQWRRCTAALMSEALRAYAAAGISPARLTPLPAAALPWLLRLPNALYARLAARALRIDPQARSSMADDLAAGREPEIDALCGAIERLGRQYQVATPRNSAMRLLLLQARRPLPVNEVLTALQLPLKQGSAP